MLADEGRTHDELNRIIGHLHELGSQKDPGWFCLVKQKDHVMARLDECVEGLFTSVEADDVLSVSTQVVRWDVIKARVKTARLRPSSGSTSSLDSRLLMPRQLSDSFSTVVGDDHPSTFTHRGSGTSSILSSNVGGPLP